MTNRRFLVIGTRPGSLGDAIAIRLEEGDLHDVVRVDHPDRTVNGSDWQMDITDRRQVVHAIEHLVPSDVVICAGVNLDDSVFARNLSLQLQVNTYGPLMFINELLDYWMRSGRVPPATGLNVCALSSNSAHIARSGSVGYCASKAALSMGLRSMARKSAGIGGVRIWGYEPGLIGDTPMTDEVLLRFDGPAHRIPSGRSVQKWDLAKRIVRDIVTPTWDMNGVMFRMDGGEQ